MTEERKKDGRRMTRMLAKQKGDPVDWGFPNSVLVKRLRGGETPGGGTGAVGSVDWGFPTTVNSVRPGGGVPTQTREASTEKAKYFWPQMSSKEWTRSRRRWKEVIWKWTCARRRWKVIHN